MTLAKDLFGSLKSDLENGIIKKLICKKSPGKMNKIS